MDSEYYTHIEDQWLVHMASEFELVHLNLVLTTSASIKTSGQLRICTVSPQN